MKFTCKNKELLVSRTYINWSLLDLYPTVSADVQQFSLEDPYTAEILGVSSEYVLFKIATDESGYLGVFYPKSIDDLTKDLYGPFHDQKSFPDLVKFLGITINTQYLHAPQFWAFPSLSFSRLLKTLNNYISAANAYGLYITSTLNGVLYVGSFSEAFKSPNVLNVRGKEVDNLATLSWKHEFSSNYSVNLSYKDGNKEENLEINNEDSSKNTSRYLSTNDLSISLYESYLSNKYWIGYYTAWQITIEVGNTALYPGLMIHFNDYPDPFIVVSSRMRFDSDGSMSTVATICRPLR